MAARFLLHHHTKSRAQRIKWLLEETGEPYELVSHDFEAGTHKRPEFLKLNPDGKLPTLVDRGPSGDREVALSESAAIALHLADACPDAGLAPPPGSLERAPYLFWMIYPSTVIEPALSDVAFPRAEPPPAGAIGWPPLAAAIDRVHAAVEPGPWLAGERFSAADLMVGSLLGWMAAWSMLPGPDRFAAYLGRLRERPAYKRAYAE